jgi:hypothetical protein
MVSMTTYRVRGIPPRSDEYTTARLLETIFGIDASSCGLIIGSLADAPNFPHRVATISFSIHVPSQLSNVNKKVEWRYSMNKAQLSSLYGADGDVRVAPRTDILFDCHFLGITPLTSFTTDHEHEIESVFNFIDHH